MSSCWRTVPPALFCVLNVISLIVAASEKGGGAQFVNKSTRKNLQLLLLTFWNMTITQTNDHQLMLASFGVSKLLFFKKVLTKLSSCLIFSMHCAGEENQHYPMFNFHFLPHEISRRAKYWRTIKVVWASVHTLTFSPSFISQFSLLLLAEILCMVSFSLDFTVFKRCPNVHI